MDLFSEIFCMGGMGGFGDGGPGGGIFMQRPPTFSRGGSEGGGRGAFGWSGMVRGGMPFFCEEDSDDDDDYDESEYVSEACCCCVGPVEFWVCAQVGGGIMRG